jgi:hypothetical protein
MQKRKSKQATARVAARAARIDGRPLPRAWLLALLLAAVAVLAANWPAVAQEGHPVKGSWLGEWQGNEVHGENVLVILDWDGRAITGMINPGTDNIAVTKAELDPDGWVLTLEADAKDRSGAAIHYVLEGRIENLELPNRSIVGTWQSQRGRGEFQISRQ